MFLIIGALDFWERAVFTTSSTMFRFANQFLLQDSKPSEKRRALQLTNLQSPKTVSLIRDHSDFPFELKRDLLLDDSPRA